MAEGERRSTDHPHAIIRKITSEYNGKVSTMNRSEIELKSKNGYQIPCLFGSVPDQKAVIICLHGFAGSKRSPRIERLHEEMRGHRIGTFTFDWPAHGDSEADFPDLTVENCMQDLAVVYDYVQEKYGVPIWCFATSFGGYLAMIFHQRHPESFGKIMLRSPALKMGQIMTAFMNTDQLRSFLDGSRMDFGTDQPLLLARDFYDDVCAHDAFSMPPVHPERIRIIHGDQDTVVPPEHSRDYAAEYGIDIHFLKGADHSYDRPGDVDWVMEQAVEFFLK